MKKIVCIFLFAEVLGFVSIFLENEYPFMNQQIMSHVNFFELFLFRFLHFVVIFYITFYIFIFRTNTVQGNIYLFCLMMIAICWRYFDKCLLNYYELKAYNIKYDDKTATLLPFIKSLFGNYKFYFLTMNAVFPMYTVSHIFNTLGYPFVNKVAFYALFFAFSIKYLLVSFYHFLDEKSVFKDLVKNFIRI